MWTGSSTPLQVKSHQDETAEDQEAVLSPLQEPGKGKGTVTAMTPLRVASGLLEVKGTGFRDKQTKVTFTSCVTLGMVFKLSLNLSFLSVK